MKVRNSRRESIGLAAGAKLPHTIQDVYLEGSITIASYDVALRPSGQYHSGGAC